MNDKEEKEKTTFNSYTIIDVVINRNKETVNDLPHIELPEERKKFLANTLQDWIFGYIPAGETASMEMHEKMVLIIKIFMMAYALGLKDGTINFK